MTEDQLEQEILGWLQDVGYTHLYGPDIAFDGSSPERANYRLRRSAGSLERPDAASASAGRGGNSGFANAAG